MCVGLAAPNARKLIFGRPIWGCPKRRVHHWLELVHHTEAGSPATSRCIARAMCRHGYNRGARFQSESGVFWHESADKRPPAAARRPLMQARCRAANASVAILCVLHPNPLRPRVTWSQKQPMNCHPRVSIPGWGARPRGCPARGAARERSGPAARPLGQAARGSAGRRFPPAAPARGPAPRQRAAPWRTGRRPPHPPRPGPARSPGRQRDGARPAGGGLGSPPAHVPSQAEEEEEEEEKASEVPAERLGEGLREPSSPPGGKRKGEPWRAAEDDNLGPCLVVGAARAARASAAGRAAAMSQGTAGGEGAPQVLPEGKESQRKRRRRKKESKTRLVRSSLLLPEAEAEKSKRTVLASNRLKTTRYTVLSFLPKNLFEQFHRLANVYFVFIALLNFLPAVSAFQPELALAPVLFILAVTAIKDLWEDYSRYRSDKEINHMECLVYSRWGGTGGCWGRGAPWWQPLVGPYQAQGLRRVEVWKQGSEQVCCGGLSFPLQVRRNFSCPWSWCLPSPYSELQEFLQSRAFRSALIGGVPQ